jgi:UDP-N-acetylmuramyl pentapeptide phosphotransferase/UDP-N-acetylglucosamine-1-phosphate transferase
VSLLLNSSLLLLIIGIVFVIETASVMMQVASYKTTGRRIFKMTPIHHHFELSGWNEWKIVIVFWSVGLLAGIAGVLLGVM